MDNLLILEDDFIKKNYSDEYKHIEIDSNSILTGNIVFKIFNYDLKIDLEDYEIYSLSNNKECFINIHDILISTHNKLCIYQNKIYYLKDFEPIITILKSNIYSDEYNVFILNSVLKKNNNIYDFIDLLDMNGFHKIYNSQYNLIKYYNNKPYLPINYCFYKINKLNNKLAKEVLINMINILKTLEYEIHPDFFDSYENNDLYQLIENYIQSNNYYLLLRVITVFKLHIDDSRYIFSLLKNENNLDKIVKLIIDKNIYDTEKLLEFLLVLNKINIFNSIYYNNKIDLDINNLIKYMTCFNSIVSFYYVLDKFFDKIKINNILPNDFLKIYLTFIKKKNNYNEYLLEYFKIIINKDKVQPKILLDEINKDDFNSDMFKKFLDVFIESNNHSFAKYIIDINHDNKNVFSKSEYLFEILNNKQEELFYYIINLFEEKEQIELFNILKDKDNNTLYHYICKNSICLGFKINNKFRNNKGFKPLDLCTISQKYYKI